MTLIGTVHDITAKVVHLFNCGEVITEALEFRGSLVIKVSKGAKIMKRYNLVPHQNQDNNGKVTNSQLDITNESQEVSRLFCSV